MTDFGTPQEWAQGAGAFKNAIDALRSALQIIKDVTSGGKRPTDDEQKVIGRALEEAEKAARLADAQTAKALGYTLCHCQFPPVRCSLLDFYSRAEIVKGRCMNAPSAASLRLVFGHIRAPCRRERETARPHDGNG